MTLPEKIAIESHVTDYLRDAVRAKLRIDNDQHPAASRFQDGDWLEVEVRSRIYDLEEVQRRGRLPEALAEGVAVKTRARTDWSLVDLPLPQVRYSRYAVVAKVYSVDDRYRKPFDPSNCFASEVEYGSIGHLARMKRKDLEAVYQGLGNPLAEAEIRDHVRRGLIVAVDENGVVYATSEQGGQLRLTKLAS